QRADRAGSGRIDDAATMEFLDSTPLASSFVGSRAWASEHVADSLALCREFGKPSLFITVTKNPNWPEITSRLGPGQTASDIPVIGARVFKARLAKLIEFIRSKLGRIVYLVKVVEFQGRGLPHAHVTLKVTKPVTAVI